MRYKQIAQASILVALITRISAIRSTVRERITALTKVASTVSAQSIEKLRKQLVQDNAVKLQLAEKIHWEKTLELENRLGLFLKENTSLKQELDETSRKLVGILSSAYVSLVSRYQQQV